MSMSRYEVFGENFLEVRRKMNRMADFFAWLGVLFCLGTLFCFWYFGDLQGEDLAIFGSIFGGCSLLFVFLWFYGRYQYRKNFLCTVFVDSEWVNLYDYKGEFVRALRFAECRRKMVEIDTVLHTARKGRYGSMTALECLVLYRNEAVFEDCINESSLLPAYGALQKHEDAMVIHNPKAINAIREQCAVLLRRNGVSVVDEKRETPREPMREQFGKPLSLLYKGIYHSEVRFYFWMSVVCLVIGAIVSAFAVIDLPFLALGGMSFLLGLVVAGLYYTQIRLYRYAVADETGVSVYSHGGKLLQTLRFSNLKAVRRKYIVEFGEVDLREKTCLVLYSSVYFPRKDDFDSLWKNEDVLVTCNPALIELLESCLSPEQILEE